MPADQDPIDLLTRALVRACRKLGEVGYPQEVGRLTAGGWVAVRHNHPRQAQHLDGAMHHIARLEEKFADSLQPTTKEAAMHVQDRIVDVRTEIPRVRHELIFETFGTLAPETGFILVNDHDPKPLYYQLAAENAGEFTWDYLEEGPEVWRVRIGRTASV